MVAEVTSKRTAFSRVFRLSDGSLRVETYSTPLFWHSGAGWKPIDDTLSAQQGRPGWLTSNGNSWKVSIGPGSSGIAVSSAAGSLSLAPLGVVGGGHQTPKVTRQAKVTKAKNAARADATSPVPASSVVDLKDLWHHAGLQVTVSGAGVADDVMISAADAPATYTFAVRGGNLVADGHGGFRLSGQIGTQFSITAPTVVLATGKDATTSSRVKYTAGPSGDLTVSVDAGWLSSLPSRDFPLRIDPDIYPAPSNFESCTSSSCPYVDVAPAGAPSGSDVQVGFDGTNTWGAAMVFSTFDSYLNQGLSVYQAGIGINAFVNGSQIYNSCYGVTPPCPTTKLNLYLQGSAQPTALGQIGQGSGPCTSTQPVATMFDPPAQGGSISADLTGVMQCIFAHNLASQWWGLTASGVSGGANPLRYYNMFLSANLHPKPAPSRVTNLQDGEVIASTTPTLQASPVLLTAQESTDNEYPEYQYQVTTGPAPNAGLVVSSGFFEDVHPCTVGQSGCSDVPPNWQVPPGALQEGVTYHAWVLTDWEDNADRYLGEGVPAVQPPSDWGVNFTVRLGLGSGGPSPTDQVGSVPGQSATPSQGAPSPGLPGSAINVNMVDGNASFSVGTPNLASVGGGLSLGFTYNSLAVGAGDTLSGLQGSFYNTVGGSSVLVGQRIDPTVEFNLPPGQGLTAAQNPQNSSATWSGVLNMPTGLPISSGDQVEIGEISSDGMTVTLGGSTYINDPGPHSPQAAPTWGAALSDTGQSMTINVHLTHASANPVVAELYLQDLTNPGVYSLSPGWLTHSPGVLSPGWTLNSSAAQATWVGLADHGTSVTVYSSDGTGFEFANAGGGSYTPPVQAPNARLHVDSSGDFVLDDPDGGLIYTFNPNGALTAVRSAGDDLHPAALSYTYTTTFLNTSTPTPEPLLRTISDPVSGRSTTLIYGGDLASGGGTACPAPPSSYFMAVAPTALLCQAQFWDSTDSDLFYFNSELAEIANDAQTSNATPVRYLFAYDSNGRLTAEEDPLTYDVIYGPQGNLRPTDCPANSPLACVTQIAYDTQGRVTTVISPAPNAGGTVANGGQAERGYCYDNQGASITVANGTATLNCSNPAANVTSVAVAGLSPSVGYEEQVRYDARERVTSTRDSAGLVTTYAWDSRDRLISTTTPAGIETSSAYDTQGHVTASYGPAPSSSFQANGQPVVGQSVATASSVYDGGMSGLAGAWYSNTALAGTPVYHSLASPTESWSGGTSPSSGSSEPNLVPSSGFSGDLTGLVNLPSAGRLSFDGDGGQVQVDGHPYLNQMGGPYPAQVTQDAPSDWWRLGEATGTTVAADSAGSDPGTYNSGVGLGVTPGPLADQDSTAASFNGNGGYVTVPDSPSLEFSNTEPFSVEAWVKIPSTGFIQPIASKLSSGSALTGWEFGIYEGEPYLLLINSWSSNAIDVATATPLTTNAWHLVTLTYDGSSKAAGVTFYVDGTAVAKGTPYVDNLTATTLSSAALTLGARPSGPYYLTGDISDVSVYPNVTLSSARVAAHHTAAGETSAVAQGPVVYGDTLGETIEADTPSVGYWRLADPAGSTSATDSWGSRNGIYNNVLLDQRYGVPSNPGAYAFFPGGPGTPSDVALPYQLFRPDSPFTVEAWFSGNTHTGPIFGIQNQPTGTTPTQYDPLLYVGADGTLRGGIWPAQVGSTLTVNASGWHDVALTYDGAGNIALIVDGSQVASASGAGASELTAAYAQIGGAYETSAWADTSTSGWDYLAGNLSDVAVYNQALTSAQLRAHYLAGMLLPYPQAVQTDGATSLWLGNSTESSLVVPDQLGSNPGTYTLPGVVPDMPSPFNGDTSGQGAQFDGAAGSIEIPDSTNLELSNTQAFSLEAWVAPTSDTTTEAVMSKMANAAPYQGWELGLTNGKPYLLLENSWPNDAIYVIANNQVAADGNWHHVAATYDGSSKAAGVTFYIDGKPVADTVTYDSLPTTLSTVTHDQMTIGSRADNGLWFAGDIADAALYPTNLTANQIANHYLSAQTAPGATTTTHTVTVTDQQFIANGHLNLTSSASGTTFDPNYGLVTQTTDPDGKVTTTSYTDSAHGIGPQFGLPTTVTQDPGGLNLTTTTTYETPGTGTYLRVLAKTLPAGSGTGSTYTYYGNTAGPIAAVCGVSSTTSQAGALEQRNDAAPATGAGDALEEQYVYDATGRQVGLRTGTVNTINSAGWQCTTYDTDGRVATQTYPAFGNAGARTVTYNYAVVTGGVANPLVNSVTDTNWGTSSISSTVDLADRVTSYTDIWGNTTTTGYDQVGRVTATNGPQGGLTYNFDPATGRATSTVLGGTLALGTDAYDSYGRLNTVYVDGTTHGGQVLYYDTNGRQYATTDYTTNVAAGETVTYSPAGRVVDQQVYDNGSVVDANPNGPNYTYDGAGRLTQAILPGATYNYSYAATTGCPNNSAGADTNRTSLTVGSTTTGYCYDNADRLTSTSAVPTGQVVYDTHGNMTQEGAESFTYDSSDQLNLDDAPTYLALYTRDPLDRPAQISDYTKITAGNTTTATATAASAISINRPSGTAVGDELIASVTTSSQQNFSAPTGWTYVDGAQSGASTTWVFAHPAASTDPASWSFGVNVLSANIVGSIVDYHNPNPTTPLDAYNAAALASSTTQPLPAVTTRSYADKIVHVVGYSLLVTPTAPSGDTQRASVSDLTVTQLVSDRYQRQPGQSAAASASSNLATTSDAITIALAPAVSTSRLGYTGETDTSGFTQNTTGATIGTTVSLADGVSYETTPSGTGWTYTNIHGDTIVVANNANTATWTGYWGPYGEQPPGVTEPSDSAISGGSLGYNGSQGKLSEGDLILMGARPYNPTDGRFTQPDPVQGGCANNYAYGDGDPIDHPDLSGRAVEPCGSAEFEAKVKVNDSGGLELEFGWKNLPDDVVAAAWTVTTTLNGMTKTASGPSFADSAKIVACFLDPFCDSRNWSGSSEIASPDDMSSWSPPGSISDSGRSAVGIGVVSAMVVLADGSACIQPPSAFGFVAEYAPV